MSDNTQDKRFRKSIVDALRAIPALVTFANSNANNIYAIDGGDIQIDPPVVTVEISNNGSFIPEVDEGIQDTDIVITCWATTKLSTVDAIGIIKEAWKQTGNGSDFTINTNNIRTTTIRRLGILSIGSIDSQSDLENTAIRFNITWIDEV